MCGLAGFLGPVRDGTAAELRAMGRAIRHRGPDAEGLWSDAAAGVALVHRRLAVVGLGAEGDQPMTSASGRYVVVFNGELYNHRTLREALEASGDAPRWRGTSDTETLLATIERHGLRSAIEGWVGMFAFALWDRETRRLTLGRDRFGEKPLYHGRHRGRVLFASELGALRASEGFDAPLDRRALALYFRHHYVPAPHSIFEGIAKLEPGTLATYGPRPGGDGTTFGEARIERYWSAAACAREALGRPFDGSLAEATDRVESLLARSIAAQAVADVPVGAFLSGGIDSSAVVALMQRAGGGRAVRTFSIGFDEPGFDESVHARAVAEHLGTEHTELSLDPARARELVTALPTLHDEPFADSSQLPTRLVAELARRDVTVSLSGDGGDELFGGYTRYARAGGALRARRRAGAAGRALARRLLDSPLVRRGPVGHAHLAVPGSGAAGRAAGRALQILAEPDAAAAYRGLLSYWHPPATPVRGSDEDGADRCTPFVDPDAWLRNGTAQQAVQLLDVLTYLPDDILVKVDRAAMQVSLETRVPLLDHRLAAFVWSLPPAWQANAADPKRILRDIACRHVPRALIERPKRGFGVPLARWLRGPLREWADDLLEPGALATDAHLDAAVVARLHRAFLAGDDAMAEPLWGVLAYRAWRGG